MDAQHRKPTLAFIGVTALCALIVGNSIAPAVEITVAGPSEDQAQVAPIVLGTVLDARLPAGVLPQSAIVDTAAQPSTVTYRSTAFVSSTTTRPALRPVNAAAPAPRKAVAPTTVRPRQTVPAPTPVTNTKRGKHHQAKHATATAKQKPANAARANAKARR